MAKQELSLSNLKNLDFGRIDEAFKQELKRVVDDCMDRPGLQKTRDITIKFIFAPVVNAASIGGQQIDCDAIKCGVEVQSGIPKRRTRVYEMAPIQGGKLAFNPDSPEDANAKTLYDADERRQDETEAPKSEGENQ